MVGLRSLIAGILQTIAVFIVFVIYFKILQIYKEKQSKLLKLLLISYLFILIGYIIMTIAVFIWSYNDDVMLFPNHFVGIFMEFRIGMAFMVVAFFYTYKFYQEVFTKTISANRTNMMLGFAIIIILYNLIVFTGENSIFDTLGFGLIFIYLFLVFIPLTKDAFHVAQKVQEKIYREAFRSIGWTGISYLAVFLLMLADSIYKMMGGPDYSIFYFFSVAFIPLILFATYKGYIFPRVYMQKNVGNIH